MKLESFTIGAIVVVAAFLGCMMLLGESSLQKYYGVDSPPNFTKVSELNDDINTLSSGMTEEVMSRKNVGQADSQVDLDQLGFYTYSGVALKAALHEVGFTNPSKSAIIEVLTYLKVNPLIIATIILVLVTLMTFAFITFFRGKKP